MYQRATVERAPPYELEGLRKYNEHKLGSEEAELFDALQVRRESYELQVFAVHERALLDSRQAIWQFDVSYPALGKCVPFLLLSVYKFPPSKSRKTCVQLDFRKLSALLKRAHAYPPYACRENELGQPAFVKALRLNSLETWRKANAHKICATTERVLPNFP